VGKHLCAQAKRVESGVQRHAHFHKHALHSTNLQGSALGYAVLETPRRV